MRPFRFSRGTRLSTVPLAPRKNSDAFLSNRCLKVVASRTLQWAPARAYGTVLSPPSATGEPYWHKIGRWRHISAEQFISYSWQIDNALTTEKKLTTFLEEVLPEKLAPSKNRRLQHIKTKQDFIDDVVKGLRKAPMAVKLTPHISSVIQWEHALDDPIRLQFVPLGSGLVQDHAKLKLDSLNEKDDSVVDGLVHRYPDKVLFLATGTCPVYCRFCTRSYAVGNPTDTVTKDPLRGGRRRWQKMYDYIRETESITDVVVSGGDTFYLPPQAVKEIGETLLAMPHVRRIRFASKGLAVVPSRFLDPNDNWTATFIELSNFARTLGKHVCLHTHFNHPNEITWITKAAAQHLFQNNVIVRNQSVLLKGVNDDVETMGTLIRTLADHNIQPYYVYQCDLVKGIEDLRTPLKVILDMEQQLRGTIAGFMMPSFVVDLPGGGGKRLAAARETYDEVTGVSTFKAPALLGKKGQMIYEYHDPKPVLDTIPVPIRDTKPIPAYEPTVDPEPAPQPKRVPVQTPQTPAYPVWRDFPRPAFPDMPAVLCETNVPERNLGVATA
ncbi:kama family protein [Westerdykella ornata]|uniref:Kama family protein n=1 Tax=Westerdykella ornata TaxID=318751 RepID=A0A6A6J9K4_WESOR|nr:kama family protein [Westerdykella ornata]KAF2272853.1 kama family protein [Westerdykella ornata]